MVELAGWGLFFVCVVSNIVIYVLIDGYFEGDIPGLKEDMEF